jgi:uncharacterized protein (DUF433 family)
VERDREIHRLRTVEGWTLEEIARHYHVAKERVRQLIWEYERTTSGQTPSITAITATAKAARATRRLALTRAHARQIIAAWRTGEEPKEIAETFELGRRRVEQVIREQATPEDRAARARTRRLAKAGLGQKPAAEQAVRYALERQPNATAVDIAAATGFSYGTATVALRKLERSGEADRTKGGRDQDGRPLRDRWQASDQSYPPRTPSQ